MAQATLVGPDLQVGREIVEVLEAAGIKLGVAMYMISSDYGDWRLALASPSLDQNDKLKAYKRVLDPLRGMSRNAMPQLVVFPMKDPMVRDLRKIFANAGDVTGMRLGGQVFGKHLIEDAYVYRIQ